MKKFKLMVLISLLFLTTTPSWATPSSLYSSLEGKTFKIFVAEPKDSTKEHDTDMKALKAKIEESLKARKSIHFEIASDESSADLKIDADVKEFLWTTHGPVDMLMGVEATAYDAITTREYARLVADISVTDLKSKKELWKDNLMARVKKSPMTKDESKPLVQDAFAKAFVKEAFSKRRV